MTKPPIHTHRLANDPVTTGAYLDVAIGSQQLLAVSDGCLVMQPEMVGTTTNRRAGYNALTVEYGEARLPLGCFVIPGESTVLIDTGVGPVDNADKHRLVGGNLVPALKGIGLSPTDIDVVALSHLHGDHAGTVGDMATGEPIFPNARHVVGAGDWTYFIEGNAGPVPVPEHTRAALHAIEKKGLLDIVDGDLDITQHVRRIAAPGHTPGHAMFCVHDGDDRVLVLGDAMYCPHQLNELEWSVAWDVDPALARRTRESLVRDLETHGGGAVGCHFPELLMGRLLT